jgi:hypothetical protein
MLFRPDGSDYIARTMTDDGDLLSHFVLRFSEKAVAARHPDSHSISLQRVFIAAVVLREYALRYYAVGTKIFQARCADSGGLDWQTVASQFNSTTDRLDPHRSPAYLVSWTGIV